MRDHARPHRHAETGPRRPAAAPAVPDVLTALRRAGNQAAGRALARAREKADQDYAMTVAGIGEFAVKSWHLGGEHEIEVMLADGPAGPALQRAASTGEPIASVVIRRAGHTVTLTDVLVTRFSLANDVGGEPLVTVGFHGAALQVR